MGGPSWSSAMCTCVRQHGWSFQVLACVHVCVRQHGWSLLVLSCVHVCMRQHRRSFQVLLGLQLLGEAGGCGGRCRADSLTTAPRGPPQPWDERGGRPGREAL